MSTAPVIRMPAELEQFDRRIRLMGWATDRCLERDDINLRYRRHVTARRGGFRVKVLMVKKVMPDGSSVTNIWYLGSYTSSGKPHWCFLKDEADLWTFAETFDTSLLISPVTREPVIFRVPPPIPPPENVSKCMCEKEELTEKEAREAVDQALIRRVLKRSRRRQERAHYPCPTQPGIFHLTSQEDEH